MWRYFIRGVLGVYQVLLRLTAPVNCLLKPKRKAAYDILLTGNFYSDNWIYAQLMPLTLSQKVGKIRMVAEQEVPPMQKVHAVYPPELLSRLVGKDIARLLTFSWLSVSSRPDAIGGFHLLVNGLLAILLARLTRARSVYICGGGPREVDGGGFNCENRIFGRLSGADSVIEKQLIDAVSHADLVVARGGGTISYFRKKGAKSRFEFIPAGIDGSSYFPAKSEIVYDLIIVGRLTEIKRVDIFLRAIEHVSKNIPDIKAAVVGDGPLMQELCSMSDEFGLTERVSFLGHREDINGLLNKSRIFMLTSDSEGLSQAMIQAMLCGLPVVVSNVGDLSELVSNGVNGYLIDEQDPKRFAEAIMKLNSLPEEQFSQMNIEARKAALRCDINSVAESWNNIFETWESNIEIK
jgi:L-malate glycosyltransferase